MKHLTEVVWFLAGVLMAVGLATAGMTQPHKIVAFLDVLGNWEADLIVVMGTAVVTVFVAYRLAGRRQRPLLGERFMIPTRSDIDARLLGGAALFGVGWGLTGICPGPAIASVAGGSAMVWSYLVAMLAGMWLLEPFNRLLEARPWVRRAQSEAMAASSRLGGGTSS